MKPKKRLVDANALMGQAQWFEYQCDDEGTLYDSFKYIDPEDVEKAPTVDAVEVVRCKDCRYSRLPAVLTQKYGLPGTMTCANQNSPCNHRNTLGDFYCSYGERKDND